MIRAALPLLAMIALSACSDRDTGTDGSEADFANRVGAGTAAPGAAPAGPAVTTAAKVAPPAGANVFALEKLGDISGVDLGPRAGGCTFSEGGNEMLIAAGPADRSLPGRAAVRVGGQLIQLDSAPGGIAGIRAGTSFTGEGFGVRVQPTAPGKAIAAITDAKGATMQISGDWVCG